MLAEGQHLNIEKENIGNIIVKQGRRIGFKLGGKLELIGDKQSDHLSCPTLS